MENLKTAVILAGGKSKRMGKNKAFLEIKGKKIIELIIEKLNEIFDEIIISIKNKESIKLYEKYVSKKIKIYTDIYKKEGPLVGIYSSFIKINTNYAYIHPIDTPIIIKKVIDYIFEKAKGYDAAVIKYENGTIDPLHSVYNVKESLKVIKEAIIKNDTSAKAIIKNLKNVNYISVNEIKKFDKNLLSLININTPADFIKIKNYLKLMS